MKFSKKILFSLFLLGGFYWANLVYAQLDYSKTPVFFVHGYNLDAGSWANYIEYLQQQSDYPALFLRAVQLSPANGSNIDSAENQIAPVIEEFLVDVNNFIAENYPEIPLKTKVDLVSHSMGGLSSRWYTTRVRPDRVRKWISLAGANHGTDVLCEWSGEGADDMCPAYAENEQESYIQWELNGAPGADVDETPYGIGIDDPNVISILPDETQNVLYVTIRTPNDGIIYPVDSTILDGTGGVNIPIPGGDFPATETSPGNISMENGVNHDGVLYDPDTITLVNIILIMNRPPVLDPIGNKTIEEGETLSFQVTGNDPDGGDILSYTASNLPTGAEFDSSTQTFDWTPVYEQGGNYPNVLFTVTDNGDPLLSDWESITITVGDVNRPLADDVNDGNGGCFIETIAYKESDYYKVELLRELKDQYLLANSIGKIIVRIYYWYSPYMAGFVGKHKFVMAWVRFNLMPIIGLLDFVSKSTLSDFSVLW